MCDVSSMVSRGVGEELHDWFFSVIGPLPAAAAGFRCPVIAALTVCHCVERADWTSKYSNVDLGHRRRHTTGRDCWCLKIIIGPFVDKII